MFSLHHFLYNIYAINPSRLFECCAVFATTTADRFFTTTVKGFDVIHKE